MRDSSFAQRSFAVVHLQRCLVATWLVPRETAASRRTFCVCTPYNPVPVYSFVRNHICTVQVHLFCSFSIEWTCVCRGGGVNMITDVLYSVHLYILFCVKRFELSHVTDIAL